jgi:hypothetical protein
MQRMLLVAAIAAMFAAPALATPYASGIQNLGGGTYSFVLNQAADNVTILRPGDTTLNLGPLPAGTHTFSVGAASGFRIYVSSSTPVGWTRISPENMDTSFYGPRGVSVNRIPGHPEFGSIYVSNAVAGTTAFGRPTQDGIYKLKADATDAGFYTGGVDWVAAGSSSPFKTTIGPDGHLYVADFSRDLAWEFSDDLSSATQLIDASNKTPSQYVESIWVEGTQAAGNRKIYLVNSRYTDPRRGLIQYDLGGNATATPGDTGTQYIGPDYFGFYPRDVARDANGDWYMNQYRYDPTQAPAISKFLDGPPPINTAAWETPMTAPFNGAYGIDVCDTLGWVAYGNYYDGKFYVFNMADGSFVGSFLSGRRLLEVAFDIAGNIYTVDNLDERLRIFSPGGDWLAITDSSGWFQLLPEPASLLLLGLGTLLLRRR